MRNHPRSSFTPISYVTPTHEAISTSQVFLVGLILQLVSFVLFTLIFVRWLAFVRYREQGLWHCDSLGGPTHDWRVLGSVLVTTCILVIVSSLSLILSV
jgi:hypothetical protein